eukprot:scaffold232841_cov50-Cyclotella_meneghiniana.AAC.1
MAFQCRPGFNCSTNTHRLAELQRGKKLRIFGLATFSAHQNSSISGASKRQDFVLWLQSIGGINSTWQGLSNAAPNHQDNGHTFVPKAKTNSTRRIKAAAVAAEDFS